MPIAAPLRVLVIGQSPRPEVAAEVALAVPGLDFVLEGALDGMSREDIAHHAAPRDEADTLFTVLPSGEAVTLSKRLVADRLAAKLCSRGPTLLCCTGAFPGLPRRADLVEPSEILNALAAALLPKGRLGLFVPLPEQVESLGSNRARPGLETVVLPLRPTSPADEVSAAGRTMAARQPDLVLLDCMSYRSVDKKLLSHELDCPILLSIEVAARAAACLLAGSGR